MLLKKGDKVICIDSVKSSQRLEHGKIYTIVEVDGEFICLDGMFLRSLPDQYCRWSVHRFKLHTESLQQPEKRKCECPIDVLMNQGCQCGGK